MVVLIAYIAIEQALYVFIFDEWMSSLFVHNSTSPYFLKPIYENPLYVFNWLVANELSWTIKALYSNIPKVFMNS